MKHETMRFCQVRRNDLVWAAEQHDHSKQGWNRVVGVDHEPWHPVCLSLADGAKLVGDANENVSVRRFRVVGTPVAF